MLKRLIAILTILGAVAAPAPLYAAAACMPHSCCQPAPQQSLDKPECCVPVVCAAEERESPAAIPAISQLAPPDAELSDITLPLLPARIHASSEGLPGSAEPPTTRIRLAHLSTLLI